MTLQEWVARSYRSYFIISSFMSFMFFFSPNWYSGQPVLWKHWTGAKECLFSTRSKKPRVNRTVRMYEENDTSNLEPFMMFFFFNSCVNGTEVIHVQFSQAEFRSSDYSENCNLKSALTTGGPSSSCEVIILRNNCHGEIIRVYIRNHFSNPFRGFPRT